MTVGDARNIGKEVRGENVKANPEKMKVKNLNNIDPNLMQVSMGSKTTVRRKESWY